MGRDIFHQPRLLRASSSLALSTAREGAATASLGNLGQGLTTLMGKNFFLIISFWERSYFACVAGTCSSCHKIIIPLVGETREAVCCWDFLLLVFYSPSKNLQRFAVMSFRDLKI